MIRVGFTLIGGMHWLGGAHYLSNLLRAIGSHAPDELHPVLFVGTDTTDETTAVFRALPGCEIVRHAVFNEANRSRVLQSALLFGRHRAFATELVRHDIDVVFEAAAYFGWRVGIPVVAWIPDFQHRAMPRNFRPLGWLRRELGFRAQMLGRPLLMLSSDDARAACARFYPIDSERIRVVRFAVPPPKPIDDAAARATADRYGLPPHYLFMPNQYFVHKNHSLVLDALLRLRAGGQQLTVMAPGRHLDPHNLGHAPRLLQRVRGENLEQQFRAPGLIPYADLANLMHASSALLNPSLYEGWSTTVEEARSAGVPMLLSDLAVHQEQAGDQATYFPGDDAEALADLLRSHVPLSASARAARRRAASDDATRRLSAFALSFVALCKECALQS